MPVSVCIASLAEFHYLDFAVVSANQFHRYILLHEDSSEGIPVLAMRHGCVDCVADLIPHTFTPEKVVHDGVAAVICHIQSVVGSQFAADFRIPPEVLPGAEAFPIVVHTVEEDMDEGLTLEF